MRLVTFILKNKEKVGSLKGDFVVDLKEARTLQLISQGFSVECAIEMASSDIPPDMVSFIEGGEETLSIARETEKYILKKMGLGNAMYPIRDVKLRAPIPKPPMILNMGNAYRPIPIIFFSQKPMTGVVGPDEPIVVPKGITDFGAVYECEIGIVIGKKGRIVPDDETAYEYVYGYTVYNDVTDYGEQIKESIGSKEHDTFCPMGPCIATKDEIKDPHNLIKRAWNNGLLATKRETSEMLHKIPEFVSMASKILTLQPGTVISTGAPNCGRLKPGDIVELEITKIGKLRNPVVAEK